MGYDSNPATFLWRLWFATHRTICTRTQAAGSEGQSLHGPLALLYLNATSDWASFPFPSSVWNFFQCSVTHKAKRPVSRPGLGPINTSFKRHFCSEKDTLPQLLSWVLPDCSKESFWDVVRGAKIWPNLSYVLMNTHIDQYLSSAYPLTNCSITCCLWGEMSEAPDRWSFHFNRSSTSISHCLIEHWQRLLSTKTALKGNVKKMSSFYGYIPNLVMLWQHDETVYELKKKRKNWDKKDSDEMKIKIGHSEMSSDNTVMSTSHVWRLTEQRG